MIESTFYVEYDYVRPKRQWQPSRVDTFAVDFSRVAHAEMIARSIVRGLRSNPRVINARAYERTRETTVREIDV